MNYGLYLSASGVAVNMYRQDVFANNLANVQTAGFKRDLAAVTQRKPEVVEGGFGFDLRHELMDRLGGGVLAGPQRVSLEQGPVNQTGQPLDVALETPGTFFAIGERDAQSGQRQVMLTRDGRFTRGSDGTLVTSSGGRPVLDVNDQPIRLAAAGVIEINDGGQIVQNGEPIARLQVTAVSDPERLVKQGSGLFAWHGRDDLRSAAPQPVVRQGYLEQSNVDPVKAMMDVTAATKAVTANGNLIRYHDLLMDRAVNVLGRVTA